MAKKAIRLESSEEILFRNDSGFFENTLVSLLEEGFEMGLKNSDRVWISYEILPSSFKGDFPTEHDLVLRKKTIVYKELKESYECCFNREYSPETEEERWNFKMALYEKDAERRSAWGAYQNYCNYANAVKRQQDRAEEERKVYDREGSKGVEKLKKKWDKEDSGPRRLVIG